MLSGHVGETGRVWMALVYTSSMVYFGETSRNKRCFTYGSKLRLKTLLVVNRHGFASQTDKSPFASYTNGQ